MNTTKYKEGEKNNQNMGI